VLHDLHWLPVASRIHFNVLLSLREILGVRFLVLK